MIVDLYYGKISLIYSRISCEFKTSKLVSKTERQKRDRKSEAETWNEGEKEDDIKGVDQFGILLCDLFSATKLNLNKKKT